MDDKQNLINSLKADYLESSPDDITNYILSSGNFRRYRKTTDTASEAIANVLVGAYGKDKAKEIVNASKLTNKEEANKYIKENMNNKLKQLIRESIQEYVKNIEEAGNIAATEAKMKACQEAIDNRKKMINMEGLDETMKEMVDKKKVKELEKEIKHLEKSLAKYEKQLEKIKNKGKKSEKPADEEKKEIVDEVSIDETNIDETFPENGPGLEETELNESYLHMQKLAGLITESEYKKKLKK